MTANGKTTYTSKSHGYSVTYPESWTKEGQSAEGSSGEIVLLNLKDREKRDNGKPNIIIYAGATIDFCNAPEEANLCKEETITVNGSEVKKFTSNETDDVYYDMGGGILFFTRANGDQRAIDDVVQSFRKI